MKKSMLVTGICGILITTNVITGWQYKKEVEVKDQVISNLEGLAEQYDSKIKLQQEIIHKQEDDIKELNYNLEIKDKKIVELSQQLKEIEARNKGHNSP